MRVNLALKETLDRRGSELRLEILETSPQHRMSLASKQQHSISTHWSLLVLPKCMGLGWPPLRADLWLLLLRFRRPPGKTEGGGCLPSRVNRASNSSF